MWCRGILRTRAASNKATAVLTSLQQLTGHGLDVAATATKQLNVVPLRQAVQRSVASNARESTIGDIIDQWSHRFETEGVPEPVESIEHIIAHVVGTKKVPTTILSFVSFNDTRMEIRFIANGRLLCRQLNRCTSSVF